MKRFIKPLVGCFALAFPCVVSAQGDTCSAGTPISGFGSHAFQTGPLGTSLFDGGGACLIGASSINQDGFYQWTATATGDVQIDTIGTGFDTKLSVHAGVGCNATCIAYDDDSGGGGTSLVTIISVMPGDSLLIQVGGFGNNAGAGTLNIQDFVGPCTGQPDDAFEDNDACGAASPMGPGSYTGLFASTADLDFYAVSIPPGMMLEVDLVGSAFDVDFNLYDANCGFIRMEVDDFSYANISGTTETLVFEALADPTNAQPCTTYDLTLTLTGDPCTVANDDSFENNDTCGIATAMPTGTHVDLFASLTDPDFYTIVVPTGHKLVVDLLGRTADVDFRLRTNTCGLILSEDSDFSWTNTASFPQTVRLEAYVDPTSGQTCSIYDLDISTPPDPCSLASGPDDAFEPNNDCPMATVLTPGTYTGLFVHSLASDFYQVTIPGFHVLEVDLSITGTGFIDFDLYGDTCAYITTRFGSFEYVNPGPNPLTISFEAYNTSSTLDCATYELTIDMVPDPCAPSNEDSFEDNENCATAAPLGDGTYTGLYASKTDMDHYATCVPAGSTLQVDMLFPNAIGDLDMYLWEATHPDCGTGTLGSGELAFSNSMDDNESITWINTSGFDVDVVLQVEVWNFSGGECNSYDLTVSGSGSCSGSGIGDLFCNPMDPNSTGASTTLRGFSAPGVGSGLHLEGTSGPPGQFGYLLIGSTTNIPGSVVSQGRLCLATGTGNFIGRYNVIGGVINSVGVFDTAGVLQNLVGTSQTGSGFDVPTTLPATGSPQITPGQTWHFQLWHRESGGQANFSNGLSVTF